MARSFDYSKWDHIELSDDESDCHPNIDKQSWFRMKHRARLEREEKEDIEVKELEVKNGEDNGRLTVIKARLAGLKSGRADEDAEFEDVDALEVEVRELEAAVNARNRRIKEIQVRRSWSSDKICEVKEERTIVNDHSAASLKAEDFVPTGRTEAAMAAAQAEKSAASQVAAASSATESDATVAPAPSPAVAPTATPAPAPAAKAKAKAATVGPSPEPEATSSTKGREKFAVISYNDYCLSHEDLLERYSVIQDLDETRDFLFRHCDILLHEHAQSYMLLSCLEDEMNGKRDRMKLVCRQSQILSHITELGVSMGRDPRDVIVPFFRRIQEKEYLAGFLKAVGDFIDRIKKRAVEKRKEMDAERLREEREKEHPLGPGGLDPYEVLESLPEALRNCFENQDIAGLQGVLAAMNPMEAKRWMKMCVDSGLWVPQHSEIYDEEEDGEPAEDSEEVN